MDSAYKFMIRTIKYSFFIFLFELVLIAIFSKTTSQHVFGLILGYVLNVLFFRVMYLNVKSKVEMSKKKAITFTRINYVARMAITALVFYLAIKSPYLSFLTCVIGVFTIKIAIYVSTAFDWFRSEKEKLS